MPPHSLPVLGLVAVLLPFSALAQEEDTDQSRLEQRLENQQQRLRELEKRLDRDQALEQRLQAQRERLRELEQSRFDSGSGSRGPQVDVSGFINAGFQSTNLGQDGPGYRQTDHEVRANNFSSAGIQVDGRITDKVSGKVQFLAEGEEDSDTRMEWAYLGYRLTPTLKVRAGRLVAPYYMNSQSFHVGYAHPWIEPPEEVYDLIDLRAVEGADITWQFNTGAVAHSLNYYFGSVQSDSGLRNAMGEPVPYRVHNSNGLNLSSSYGNWNTWLAYSISDADLDMSNVPINPAQPSAGTFAAYSLENDHAYFSSAGFEYDNGNFMVMAEHAELGVAADWIPGYKGHFVTLGYHFGAWTPHITWAAAEDEDFEEVESDPLATGLYNGAKIHQKSWTLGLRHDVAPGLALKAEISTFYDLGASDDNGYPDRGFFNITGPTGQPDSTRVSALDDEDDPMVFRISADLAF